MCPLRLCLTAALLGLWAAPGWSQVVSVRAQTTGAEVRASADRIVVRPRDGLGEAEIQALHAEHGGRVLEILPLTGLEVVAVVGEVSGTVAAYAADPRVDLAEANVLHELLRLPSDSLYTAQRHLGRISCPAAWDVTTGSREVVVAVIDSGTDTDHPDLRDNLWRNPGETPGNRVDDDGNGYIDDVLGWDFVGKDGGVEPEPDGLDNNNSGIVDENVSHGTAVAGCIAAMGDNGTGVAGVAWTARIMTLKVFADDGYADTGHIAEAILYAARNGAHIINMSLGGGYHGVADQAIREAVARGALLVAAGGNDAIDLDRTPQSPVSNDLGENMILGVAATTEDDRLAAFSAYGGAIDVAAPGVGILTTSFHDGTIAFRDLYRSVAGTSFAAPVVAGVAALVLASHPGLRGTALRDRLLKAVDDTDSLNPGFAGRMGSGRVNAGLAVSEDLDRRPSAPSGPTPKVGASDTGSAVSLRWSPSVDPRGETVQYDVYFGDSEDPPLLCGAVEPRAVVSDLEPGYDYRWRVVARNESGFEHEGPMWGFTAGGEDVYEPDNVPAQASSIAADGRHQRRRLSSGDADHALLEATVGTRYEIRTRATVPGAALPPSREAGGNEALDTVLALMDQAGRAIAQNDDIDPGRNLASRILWTCSASGTYLVRVTGYEGTSAGPYSLSIGRLSDASDRPPAAPTDPSPADLSVANPTSVGLAWRAADGSLPEAYDVLVRDSSGGLVSSAEGLSQPRLSLSGLVSDETYTWAVRSSDGSGRMAQGPTWRFSVGLTDPYEPDDSSDAAGVISPSVPQVRAFSSDADVDRARFGARAGQSYRASASAATIEPIAPARLAIVDLEGHELASGLGAVTLTPSADSVLQVVCTPAEGAGFYRLDLDGPSPEPHGMRVRCEHDALIHGDELHLMGEVLDEHGIPVPGVPYAVTVGPPGQEPQAGPFESVTDSGGVIDMRLTDLGRQLGLLEALVEAGALSARAGFTVSFRHVLPPPEGAARLRMATAPVGGTPETVFGLGGLSADAALASYLPEEERYRIHTGVEVAVEPGRGYFLYQAVPLTLSADAGMLPDPATHSVVALGRGWNIIGNPFARPILWSLDGFGVRRDGERVGSLREAADRGLIDPYGWAWDPQTDTYQLVFDAGSAGVTKGALDPYEAVWIYARERGLGLEIPPPSPHRASAEAAQRGSVDSSVLRLRVSTESGDSRELIAAFDGQTGIEGAAPPAPPGAAAAIRAEFVDGVQAGALGHLCRGRSVELVVQAGEAPGRFSLSWPDMRSLDREIKPTLEDMTAGRAYSLRTSRPLYIDLGVGEARHFRLTWTVADAWLRLAILDAQSGARGATVRGHLSRAATLEARVMNQAGRVVRRLVLGDHGAGEIEVHWNGRDDRGSSVPAGVYALELIADADDGEHASVRTQVMR